MVYLTSTLTAAACLSLALGVSALPANPSENGAASSTPSPTNIKRDGPLVVQARSVQKTKKSYVGGGGDGMKKLRQVPMMKPGRMLKAKRGLATCETLFNLNL